MEGSPYVLEVTDLTLKDDGTQMLLSACTDCAVYIEFNEDGLPSFFAVAQEDVGYQTHLHPHRRWPPDYGQRPVRLWIHLQPQRRTYQ